MSDERDYWKPTSRLRWVQRRTGPDKGMWLEQEHVWSPPHEEWGGETKWVRVPVVQIEDAGQCDDPRARKDR